jgi:tRNA 2-thiouridine synthesizing protein D
MKLSIAVFGAPHSSQASESAFRFVSACLDKGHKVPRVFFYHDGVHNASKLAVPPQDETQHLNRWQTLAKRGDIDLVVCVAAALRRGIVNREEASRYDLAHHNLADGFEISGLGQLLDAAVSSDRLITFGR